MVERVGAPRLRPRSILAASRQYLTKLNDREVGVMCHTKEMCYTLCVSEVWRVMCVTSSLTPMPTARGPFARASVFSLTVERGLAAVAARLPRFCIAHDDSTRDRLAAACPARNRLVAGAGSMLVALRGFSTPLVGASGRTPLRTSRRPVIVVFGSRNVVGESCAEATLVTLHRSRAKSARRCRGGRHRFYTTASMSSDLWRAEDAVRGDLAGPHHHADSREMHPD